MKIRLLGGIRVDWETMRISFNAGELNSLPLEHAIANALLLTDMDEGVGPAADIFDVVVEIKSPTHLSSRTLAALGEVLREDPPLAFGGAAEELEAKVSSRAFGRLTLIRGALHGPAETEGENLGAAKMLMTLDDLGALDADTINGLLDGPVVPPRTFDPNADYDEDEEEGEFDEV